MSRLLLAALLLTAVGCASEPSDEMPDGPPLSGDVEVQSNETPDAAEPALAADADTTGPARVEVGGETVPARGVVTDMQSGDVSCYLTVRTDDGASDTVHADYSVCDSNVILGRRVQIEYAQGDVLADSCEGDPECLDTETVALAIVAQPID
ncbi:hypothetical protein B1759_15205 [Rubrivirga sp. SAORIC476]|uniref:hypothetical protein n=1 Tax=Rubrivirga sp. SAORIC476 TaxID=1961794 RepID=UPI000BA93072|nr:hypothetical protein [Rubrivirga sp. SAORIC476]MAQ92905.1 hypothetical protein [Rhodothermaceae bacterium]MBC14363.1 hypothetical protein [Rhodothermaceae bacterium]PAP79665.1 hypothetical protein B1759_15205 [Rubrivirga sp. SAORIC476]